MITQAIRYCIALSLVVAFGAQADVIERPSTSPQIITSHSAPVRGMTKKQVESNFGSPKSISGPLGSQLFTAGTTLVTQCFLSITMYFIR